MTKLKFITKGLLGASILSLCSAGTAFAGGTQAGTNVQNTFSLTYDVNSVTQPAINNNATPTEFTVDRLVDLTVLSQGDKTVAPGALNQELVFSVTNNGNDTQAYDFTLVNEAGDSFDATGLNITYYVDDGDGVFQQGGADGAGVAYTLGSASPDILADRVIWVVIDGDIPSSVLDTNTSDITLVADTLQPTTGTTPGAAVVADVGGNTLTGVAENVLADGTGTANENANEGDHSDTGTYIVASANLAASKAVTIFKQDGTGCSTIPGVPGAAPQYSIPGACIEYVITVVNGGATASATNLAISDTLDANLRFIAAGQSVFTGGTLNTPAANTDCVAGACVIGLTGATLAAGATGKLTIRALVK